jgi:hypothetical protein
LARLSGEAMAWRRWWGWKAHMMMGGRQQRWWWFERKIYLASKCCHLDNICKPQRGPRLCTDRTDLCVVWMLTLHDHSERRCCVCNELDRGLRLPPSSGKWERTCTVVSIARAITASKGHT